MKVIESSIRMKNKLGVNWAKTVESPKSIYSFNILNHSKEIRDVEPEFDDFIADQYTPTTEFDGNEIFRQIQNLASIENNWKKIRQDCLEIYLEGADIYFTYFFSKTHFTNVIKEMAKDFVYYPLEYFNAFGKNMGFPLNTSKLESYGTYSLPNYSIDDYDYCAERIPPIYLIFSRVQPRNKDVKSVEVSKKNGYLNFNVSESTVYPAKGKTRVVAGSQTIRNRMLGPIQCGMKALMKASLIHNSAPPYHQKFSYLASQGYQTLSCDITKCDENNAIDLQIENIRIITKIMSGIIDHPEVKKVLDRAVECFKEYYNAINLFRYGDSYYMYKSSSLRSGDLLTTPHNAMSVTFIVLGLLKRAGLIKFFIGGQAFFFNYGDDCEFYFQRVLTREQIISAINNPLSPFVFDVSSIESFLMRDVINFKSFLTRACIMTCFLEREKKPELQKYALYARASELGNEKRSVFANIIYNEFGRNNIDWQPSELSNLKQSLQGYDSMALEDLVTLGYKLDVKGEIFDISEINRKMTDFRRDLSRKAPSPREAIDMAENLFWTE